MFRLCVFILILFSNISFGALNTWSVPTTVAVLGDGSIIDDMAMSGDTAIVLFRNPALSLFTTYTTDHGQTWSTPVFVAASVNNTASIAMNGNGSVVLCAYPINPSIFTVSSTNLGQTWSSTTLVSGAGGRPTVAINSIGDRAYIGFSNNSDNATFVSFSTNQGGAWEAAVPIDGGGLSAIATNSLGDKTYFLSTTGTTINSYFSSDLGATWSAASLVTNNARGGLSLSISADGEKAFASWADSSNNSYFSYGTNHGANWQLAGAPAPFPSSVGLKIANNDSGTIAIITSTNLSGDLFSYYTTSNGASWNLINETAGTQQGGRSFVGMNNAGTLGVRVWYNSTSDTIFSSFSDFGPPSPVTTTFNVVGKQEKANGLFQIDIVNTLSWNSIPSAETYRVKNTQQQILFDGIANNFYAHGIKNGESTTYFVSYVVGGVESSPVIVTLP